MSGILGWEFYQGPEVPPPAPIDQTLPHLELSNRRADWLKQINEAVQDHDPWGFMKVHSDGDVELFDASLNSTLRLVQTGHTAFLVLAREL